jgi:hypothetical protein
MFIVYQVEHLGSGKRYFGWTSKTTHERFHDHCKRASKLVSTAHFDEALRKYGVDAFLASPVAYVATPAEAKAMERKLIAKYLTSNKLFGFNSTIGGDGVFDPSGEIAAKISATLKGRGAGVPKSEATKAKMRLAQRTPEMQAIQHRNAAHMHASPLTHAPETYAKIAAAKRGIKLGPCSTTRRGNIKASVTEWWRTKRREEDIESGQMRFEF